MNKSSSITFRVSDHEKKRIISKSATAKISMSDFCRYAALGKEIKRIDGLKELNYELNKIGNNINQMAIIMHQRKIYNPDLSNIGASLLAVFDNIVEVFDGGDDHSNNQTN